MKQPSRPITSRRAAIYARFSTDLQNDRSIEDQVEVCRALAHREGLAIVQKYEDRARSGASIFGRDGLAAMLKAADNGAFDVVIVEAFDRLSRDMADLAGIHRTFSFQGIELRAVHDGVADTVTVGLRGLVAQLYREDGAKKVRRGMAGVVREGRYAGGRPYGYKTTPGQPGVLQINQNEAEIVRRIFREFVDGRHPRDIAGGLNRERVRAPRGASWNASTINGSFERACGIIQNGIYGGEIVWNRVRMVKDPSTGRRVSRPNPEAEWQRMPAPHLAIIDPETIAAARRIKNDNRRMRRAPGPIKPARSALSGLLRCGVCGSGMSKHDNMNGRPRIRCSRSRESGSCDNTRRYRLDDIEHGTIAHLREELNHPELLTAFIAEYQEEQRRLDSRSAGKKVKTGDRLASVKKQIERIVDAIADGAAAFNSMRSRMEDLDQERRALEEELAAGERKPNVVALHPEAMRAFKESLERLSDRLSVRPATGDALDCDAFRALVDRVVVHPPADPKEPPKVEVYGKLAAIFDLDGLGLPKRSTSVLRSSRAGGSLVAEVRFFESPNAKDGAFSFIWAA